MQGKLSNGKTGLIISLSITIIGILMIVLPIVFQMEGMDGGFALNFVGIVIALTGFVSCFIFNKRKKVLERMLQGDVIARFTYDEEQWNKMVSDSISGSAGIKAMGIILGAIFGVIGLVFLLADDELLLFFIIMMALCALFSSMGFISSAMNVRRLKNCPPEAIITHDGVYYMGVLYDFNGKTSVLDSVRFYQNKNNVLVFSYRQLTGRGIMARSKLSVPVPSGMEEYGAIVEQFFKN